MNTRKRRLSTGWYPDDASDIKDFIRESLTRWDYSKNNSTAVIVPHAGWFFSGSLALRTISTLSRDSDTIIVLGGHLAPGSQLYYAAEDSFETPLGGVNSDKQIIEKLKLDFSMVADRGSDNTVEVIIPFIKYFFPKSKVVWLRIGSGPESIELGAGLHRLATALGRKCVVIGSTDLTHYGRNFQFVPKGSGLSAVKWVKEINDKDIINKMIKLDSEGVLFSANNYRSACSAGGAVGAISYASHSNVEKGDLTDYFTSYDISPSESFVGYAGISF